MSLELPTISVIVFASDGCKYLSATLNSIRQQTYSDFEVLVFSHNYRQTILQFDDKQDSRFKFFFPKNLNIAQTLNRGISEAKGKYISWIYTGDFWHPTKLQKQLFYLEHYPEAGGVYSWLMGIDHEGRATGKIVKLEYSEEIYAPIDNRGQICAISLMVPRSCFQAIGLFDPQLKIIPGWDLWLRLNHHYSSLEINEPLVYWRECHTEPTENWQTLETDLQITIEKAFQNKSLELSHCKSRSYGYVSLFLAKTVLSHQEPDPKIAHNYCRQALEHYPALGLSFKFLQISLAIITLSCLHCDRYLRLVSLIQRVEFIFREISYQLRVYSHRLLEWMLEEEDFILVNKSKVKRQAKD
ncbi:MAG: glycosyltransferase family A protein [Cyanobacteria bacterium P01_A01_bin.83]